MEYVVAKAESKSEYIYNKYHRAMLGRECDILHLMRGTEAKLMVDMVYDPGNPHRYRTTPVLDIRNLEDGAIIFETENSVYTLIPKLDFKGESL